MLNRIGPTTRYLAMPLIVFAGCLVWILQENLEFAELRTELDARQETYAADAEST